MSGVDGRYGHFRATLLDWSPLVHQILHRLFVQSGRYTFLYTFLESTY